MSSRTEYDAASRISFTVEDDVDATENQYYGINRRIKRFDAENNQIEYIYLMLRG